MEALSYYAIMALLLALLWLLIFLTKKSVRKEMLVISILSLFLLPIWIATQATQDSVARELFSSVSFLDLLFLFSLSGIAAVIYHAFFGKHYVNMPKPKRKADQSFFVQAWILGLFFALLAFTWITILLVGGFSLNTPTSMLIAAIILAVYLVSHRHDLLGDSIWSALLTAFIVFMASALSATFTQTTPALPFIQTDAFVQGVPLDLIYWALAMGLVLGPAYEFIRRKLLRSYG